MQKQERNRSQFKNNIKGTPKERKNKLTFISLPFRSLKQDERCGKEGEGEEKCVKQRHWKQVIQNNPRRCEPRQLLRTPRPARLPPPRRSASGTLRLRAPRRPPEHPVLGGHGRRPQAQTPAPRPARAAAPTTGPHGAVTELAAARGAAPHARVELCGSGLRRAGALRPHLIHASG